MKDSRWKELIRETETLYKRCELCPWECRINRFQKEGKCLLDYRSRIFYKGILYGEEIEISPCYGVFFAGCNLKCIFCECGQYQVDPRGVKRANITQLISSIKSLKGSYRTLQFIGGEPSLHLLTLIKILRGLGDTYELPVVLNSNMYFSVVARPIMAEITHTFLADFHFGNDVCAHNLSGARNYCATVFNNIAWALERKKRVLVRHLVMPGHLECCMKPVITYFKEMKGAHFSVLFNYYPCFEAAKDVRINKSLSRAEKEAARGLLEKHGIRQESESYTEPCNYNFSAGNKQEIIIDNEGNVIIQYITGDMLKLASKLNPENIELKRRKKVLLGE